MLRYLREVVGQKIRPTTAKKRWEPKAWEVLNCRLSLVLREVVGQEIRPTTAAENRRVIPCCVSCARLLVGTPTTAAVLRTLWEAERL